MRRVVVLDAFARRHLVDREPTWTRWLSPSFLQSLFEKTPLLAAGGFEILVILIQCDFIAMNQNVTRRILTFWGGSPALLGA